jgi:segregation and condensation protein B
MSNHLRSLPGLRPVERSDACEQRFHEGVRIAEAMLFAASEPIATEDIARLLPQGVDAGLVLAELEHLYRTRGVTLQRAAGKWLFRTATDLGYLLRKEEAPEERKLGRAALETLAIIAYHQPVTRAEIEELRGVSTHKGTLDTLLEAGFIRLRGRRRTPGRPVTFGTTEAFLIQFGLDRISDLPNLAELDAMNGGVTGKGAFGLLLPSDDPALRNDEDPLEPDLFDVMLDDRLEGEAGLPALDPDGQDVSAEPVLFSRCPTEPNG